MVTSIEGWCLIMSKGINLPERRVKQSKSGKIMLPEPV